jgi:hypothetical protein
MACLGLALQGLPCLILSQYWALAMPRTAKVMIEFAKILATLRNISLVWRLAAATHENPENCRDNLRQHAAFLSLTGGRCLELRQEAA